MVLAARLWSHSMATQVASNVIIRTELPSTTSSREVSTNSGLTPTTWLTAQMPTESILALRSHLATSILTLAMMLPLSPERFSSPLTPGLPSHSSRSSTTVPKDLALLLPCLTSKMATSDGTQEASPS